MKEALKYIHDASLKKNHKKYCKWIRLAYKRHLDDLKKSKNQDYPFYFDIEAGEDVVNFMELLRHYKGSFAGERLKLEPWQKAAILVGYGWKCKDDDSRRFKTIIIFVGRKNGKTTMAAGLGLNALVADGEQGAEVYCAATKKDQAKIPFSDAVAMVKGESTLRKTLGLYRNAITFEATNSKMVALSSDADTLDGLNASFILCDELSRWNGRDLWDVLRTSFGARDSGMQLGITTGGYDKQSICYILKNRIEDVCQGVVEDDSFFGLYYTIDEKDEIENESCWIKANPNLGVSKSVKDLRKAVKESVLDPTSRNSTLRFHFNVWTDSDVVWMPHDVWVQNNFGPIDIESLEGRSCYGGLDLSSKIDISALVWVFPPDDDNDKYIILPRFWIPSDSAIQREKRDRVPYITWARQGYITMTDGNVIDYDFIEEQIRQDMESFDVQEIAFDPWKATQITNHIAEQDEDMMVAFRQGYGSLDAPTQDLMVKARGQLLNHGGNPVLMWMAANAVAKIDPTGSIKLDKSKSREKIDGMIALVMALGRATFSEDDDSSAYDNYDVAIM